MTRKIGKMRSIALILVATLFKKLITIPEYYKKDIPTQGVEKVKNVENLGPAYVHAGAL
jgi:hypothetical protein